MVLFHGKSTRIVMQGPVVYLYQRGEIFLCMMAFASTMYCQVKRGEDGHLRTEASLHKSDIPPVKLNDDAMNQSDPETGDLLRDKNVPRTLGGK
ncbi:hypothetical protein TSTA_033420 [Talaromyces stipitatus ATCC 10500]|uniref:Uncharacterized protein n=1 Tax=Talaromyces stipitatus (strain ATCC 10500 / CBS 375.48 / QM 6759 / NRRL 1006) TaxID=441959 RepID=B8M5X2_TALSN|nr:uncharacterized protein TSTA_033420 [Talaromyces stipitatus ATCC 10500]EED20099.1 hypothetical protein TSTA_033420 [Talaromyces stipitatus ATCC 10500]